MKKLVIAGSILALGIAASPIIKTAAYQIPPSLPPCGASILVPPKSPYVVVQCEEYTDANTGQHYDALYYDLSGVPIK